MAKRKMKAKGKKMPKPMAFDPSAAKGPPKAATPGKMVGMKPGGKKGGGYRSRMDMAEM